MTDPTGTRPLDKQRATSLVLALVESDGKSFTATMKDVQADQHPTATSGLLFAAVGLAAKIALSMSTPAQAAAALRLAELEYELQLADDPPPPDA